MKYLVFQLEELECDEGRYIDETTGNIYFGYSHVEVSLNDVKAFEELYEIAGYKFTPLKLSKSVVLAEASRSAYVSLYFQEGGSQKNLLNHHPNMLDTSLFYLSTSELPLRIIMSMSSFHGA